MFLPCSRVKIQYCFVFSLFHFDVVSYIRCLVLSLFRTFVVRTSLVSLSRTFAVSQFHTFLVSYFRCFILSLFRTFVVSLSLTFRLKASAAVHLNETTKVRNKVSNCEITKVRNNERKYETTNVRNCESTKQRKYETTQVQNNERAKLRNCEKRKYETAKVRNWEIMKARNNGSAKVQNCELRNSLEAEWHILAQPCKKDPNEVLVDIDSSDGVLWETDQYPWSRPTVGQNPVFKMAYKMAAIYEAVC